MKEAQSRMLPIYRCCTGWVDPVAAASIAFEDFELLVEGGNLASCILAKYWPFQCQIRGNTEQGLHRSSSAGQQYR